MLTSLKNWFGGKRASRSAGKRAARPARRTQLALETLEGREVPAGLNLVPLAGHVPANVFYINTSSGADSGWAHSDYSREKYTLQNGVLRNDTTNVTLACNVREFALCAGAANGKGDVVVALSWATSTYGIADQGNMTVFFNADYVRELGRPIVANPPTTSITDGNVANFRLSGDGAVSEVHGNGFFVRWTGASGAGAGSSATIMLGNVVAYDVAPNGAWYTLNTSGRFDVWVGAGDYQTQYGVIQFATDSHNNWVTRRYDNRIFINGGDTGHYGFLGYYGASNDVGVSWYA